MNVCAKFHGDPSNYLSRYLTKKQICQADVGARLKVKGSTKVSEIRRLGQRMCAQN